jgi:hypothetical protein
MYRQNRELNERIALWTTAAFALMPSHYEAIIWLSGRTDSIALLFAILSVHAYVKFRKATGRQQKISLGLSALFFAIALLTKESIIALPGILFVIDIALLDKKLLWKQRLLPLIPFALVIGGFVAARVAIIGSLVSSNAAFTEQYSLIPNGSTIVSTLHAMTFVFNRSTITEWLPQFPTLWKWLYLPICLGLTAVFFVTEKLWKQRTRLAIIIAGIIAFVLTCIPVFSLMKNITPDLMHMRLLYAPSVCVAFIIAVLFAEAHTRVGHSTRNILVGFGVVICVAATIVNAQPWFAANTKTEYVVDTFIHTLPELAGTHTKTVAYVLHTPSEYRGAYIFHDYYSLQQAITIGTDNPLLTVQTVGTKPVYPAPYCDETLTTQTHVLSWEGDRFTYQDKILSTWNDVTPQADFTLTDSVSWNNATIETRGAKAEVRDGALVLTKLGEHPQLHVTLPEGSHTSDWKTLSVRTNAQAPLLFSWDTLNAKKPTFQSIVIDDTDAETSLCAYPNWIVQNSVRTIALTFTPGEQETITVSSLELQ